MKKKRDSLSEKEIQEQANKDFLALAKARGFNIRIGQGETHEMIREIYRSFQMYYGETPTIIRKADFGSTSKDIDVVYNLRNSKGTVELVLTERYTSVDG